MIKNIYKNFQITKFKKGDFGIFLGKETFYNAYYAGKARRNPSSITMGSEGLTVTVTPPENVQSGDYTINCTAVSSDETLKLALNVTITGTYEVLLTTPTGNLSLDAYAGEESPVTLSIQNTGNVDLTNLQLSSAASTDWNVRFDETTIDTLEAGTSKEITAYIQPSEEAIIGDYVTALTISNEQTSSEMDLRVSVQNHTTWGIAAVAIIVVLCVGLGLIIRKYGRR